MRLYIIIWWLTIALFDSHAFAGQGNCGNFQFPITTDGKVDWPHTVKVIRRDTPVYQDAKSSSAIPDTLLNFNQSFRVIDVQGNRVRLGNPATLAPIGWVDRAALLCATSPIKGNAGLEQKFFVALKNNDAASTAKVCFSPDLLDCEEHYQTLANFSGYFVYDHEQENYLLGETYRLDDTSQLVGWIKQSQGFLWTTSYGLRPKEHLTFPDGHPMAGVERIVCAYAAIEEAIANPVERCLPIYGGTRWFLSAYRLPLLERVDYHGKSFYKAMVFSTGLPLDASATEQEPRGETMFEAYLPVSDDLVEDVWLKVADLDKWVNLLTEFENEQLNTLSGQELRQTFVFAIVDALEKILSVPLRENTEEPLKDYLQYKGGLPVRDDSPLFRYSINELMNPRIVPDCEIVRLIDWVNHTRKMLDIAYHGDQRPDYAKEPFPGECPTGEQIPFISSEIRSVPLGNNPEMRYDHNFQQAHIYWIPKEYLP